MMTVHVGWVLHRPTLPEVSLHSRLLSLGPSQDRYGYSYSPEWDLLTGGTLYKLSRPMPGLADRSHGS